MFVVRPFARHSFRKRKTKWGYFTWEPSIHTLNNWDRRCSHFQSCIVRIREWLIVRFMHRKWCIQISPIKWLKYSTTGNYQVLNDNILGPLRFSAHIHSYVDLAWKQLASYGVRASYHHYHSHFTMKLYFSIRSHRRQQQKSTVSFVSKLEFET